MTIARYNLGETVKLYLRIDDATGAILVDPSSTPIITVTDPNGTVVTNAQNMTRESLGIWYYNQPTTNYVLGQYQVSYSVTDGTYINIQKYSFILGR